MPLSLEDAPWSVGPVEVDSNQNEKSIEKNQLYTMHEIADILKIAKSIKLFMKMKKCAFFIMEKKPHRLFGQPNILIIFFYFCASIFKTISIYISFFMIFKRLIGFYFIPFCCQADWKLYGLFIFIY